MLSRILSVLLLAALFPSACGKKKKSPPPAPNPFQMVEFHNYGQSIDELTIGRSAHLLQTANTLELFSVGSSLKLSQLGSLTISERPILLQTETQRISIVDSAAVDLRNSLNKYADQSLSSSKALAVDQIIANAATNDRYLKQGLVYVFVRGRGLMLATLDAERNLNLESIPGADFRITPTRMLVHDQYLLILDAEKGLIIYSLANPRVPAEIDRLALSGTGFELLALDTQTVLVGSVQNGVQMISRASGSYKLSYELALDGALTGLAIMDQTIFATEKRLADKSRIERIKKNASELLVQEFLEFDGRVSALAADDDRSLLFTGSEEGLLQVLTFKNDAVVGGK